MKHIDDLCRLDAGESGFVLSGPLAALGEVRPHAIRSAKWLSLAYLKQEKKYLDESWAALSEVEKTAFVLRLLRKKDMP